MRFASLLVIAALVPSLALAKPKKKKKAKAKKAEPEQVEPATTEPAPPPPTVTPATVTPTTPAAATPATPAPPPPPVAVDEPAEPAGADVDTLRQEYLALRDELFKSRARASTVASQLYSTRVQIKLTYTTGRFYTPAKATIRLDGASVYDNASGAIATDDGVRFDGYIAPGRHLITFRVEATGKDDDSFTTVTESQIVVKAVAGKDLLVAAKAKDSGDIAFEWKKKEGGTYGLGLDVSVTTQARAAGK